MPAIARNGYLYGASPQVPIDAEDVRYDNSTSELESTDVQSAIGELKELIDEGGGGSQVQSDWDETDTSSAAYIQHKPTLGTASSKDSTTTISEGGTALPTAGSVYTALSGKVDVEAGKGLSSNDYTDTEKTKLAGIESGAEVNVQSNWNETDTSSDAYIQNKPTLGSAASKDVPTSGNASTTEVVMGNDTRLSDSRNAADVYSWAKAETKPSYTASEVGAIATTAKGANNGVAELDSTGKVPSSQLPSYVDDVLEYDSLSDFPLTGEEGKIYVAKDTNKTYRWSGSAYVEISPSLALGETSSTAYRGDRGKIAYDHSQVTSGNPHNVTKAEVGLGNVSNLKQFEGTLQEWNALTTEQKKTYDEYKITDDYVEPDTPVAEDVEYDNTSSGLISDNVQDAIDELKSSSINDHNKVVLNIWDSAHSENRNDANKANALFLAFNGWDQNITNFPTEATNKFGILVTVWGNYNSIGDLTAHRSQTLTLENGNVFMRSYDPSLSTPWTAWQSGLSNLNSRVVTSGDTTVQSVDFKCRSGYACISVNAFVQNVGCVIFDIIVSGGVVTTKDCMTGEALSSSVATATYSNGVLTVTFTNSATYTAIYQTPLAQ